MLRPALQKLLNTEPVLGGAGSENVETDRSGTSTPEKHYNSQSSGCPTPESSRRVKCKVDDDPEKWETEISVYEVQLTQLQEQLVETMLENQQLATEIKSLKEKGVDTLRKEVEEEKKKRKKVEEQLRRQKPKRPPRPSIIKKTSQASSECESEFDYDDLAKELEAMNGNQTPSSSANGTPVISARNTSALMSTDGKDDVKDNEPTRLLRFKIAAWNFLHERISDFICDEDAIEQEEEEEPLAVKRLRENVARFTNGVQPIKEFINSIQRLFSWKNPWMTLSAFLIYMYSVWLGLFVPLMLLLGILKLTSNFLFAKGIAQKFGYHRRNEEKEEQKEETTSWSEKYQLVLQIARKVQNTLGGLADSLEKCESLFLWQHEEASKKLYTAMCIGFVLSLLLSTRIFFLLLGLSLGLKMFLVTPIYNRFPKVKRRYDDIDRLWNELPTHLDLEAHRSDVVSNKQEEPKTNDGNEMSRPSSRAESVGEDVGKGKSELSWESIVFCDRFQLPACEVPLAGWQEGRRCTLLNKDNPLSNMKHGRLYLTKHFLCFERNQYHSKKNLAFHLQDIIHVLKAKPLSFLPGGGMAVEVKVKEYEKPFTFGAMMARDEAYESIILAGKQLNAPWSRRN